MEHLNQCPICESNQLDVWMQTKDYFLTQESFDISICKACGFRFTNARPEAERLGAYYKSEEYISHSNAKKGLVNGLYQFVRQLTLKQKYQQIATYQKGGKLLDIGCATGEFLNFSRSMGFEVCGVEPDADARGFAQKTYNLEVNEEDFLDKAEDASFDVITMWHVLEHVPNLNERIKQLMRLLKPGGLCVIALPNVNSYDARIYGEYWAALDVPRHLYHFGQKDILNLMEKHGFRFLQGKGMPFDAFYVSILSEKYKNSSLVLPKAFLKGLRSNLMANSTEKEYSSLTYFFQKPK